MKTIKFDGGHHRRFISAGQGEDAIQQYYPSPLFDPTFVPAMDRIRQERRDCANIVANLHANKKICAANKDFDGARLLGKIAKEYEGWVKAATWLLGWMGDGPFVHPKDWSHELWPQLDGLIAMGDIVCLKIGKSR